MPCWEPPFGELVAIDMKTGDVKWRRPMGASQKYGFYMPESMGSPTIGGPAVTAGGLIFIGASMDAKVRAYSLETGDELWADMSRRPSVSNPAVYEYEGREYVAFIAGGNTDPQGPGRRPGGGLRAARLNLLIRCDLFQRPALIGGALRVW